MLGLEWVIYSHDNTNLSMIFARKRVLARAKLQQGKDGGRMRIARGACKA